MGPTCHYVVVNEKNYPQYWILYSAVAIVIQMFLFELVLFLIVYLFNKNNKILSILISLILLSGCFHFLYEHRYWYKHKVYTEGQRKRQYLIDKMMVFYSKKNKIAILPKDGLIHNYSITENNQMMPYEVLLGTDNNKLFSEVIEYSVDGSVKTFPLPIFQYIKEVYQVDVAKFITFRPEKEAIELFIKDGGTLTEDELVELNFSKISE